MSYSNLQEALSGYSELGNVNELKLKDILSVHSKMFGFKPYQAFLPPVEIGSITLVDQVVLMCFLDLVAPKEVLEIGTFKGFTTRFLLENSDEKTNIKSIDLPKSAAEIISADQEEIALQDGDYNDDYLRRAQLISGEIYLAGINESQSKRLELVKADSTKLDYAKLFSHLEFAFIDGGHDYGTVKSDTENVLKVMQKGVILWHDFSSAIHSDVTSYLAQVSQERPVFHIKGSLLAFTIIQ